MEQCYKGDLMPKLRKPRVCYKDTVSISENGVIIVHNERANPYIPSYYDGSILKSLALKKASPIALRKIFDQLSDNDLVALRDVIRDTVAGIMPNEYWSSRYRRKLAKFNTIACDDLAYDGDGSYKPFSFEAYISAGVQ